MITILLKNKNLKTLLGSLSLIISLIIFTGCSAPNNLKKTNEESSQKQSVASNDSPAKQSNNANTGKISTIHFIDTGNSDSILIKGEKNILIDGGDTDDDDLLINYLNKENIKNLDYVIATHPDSDHIGGLDSIIKSFPINNLIVSNGSKDTKAYKDFITAASEKGLAPSVPLDNKKFELSPHSYLVFFNSNGGKNSNEQSIITLYVNGTDKMLFTGDAGFETESEILDNLMSVDLLKVGHHGSKHSTSAKFLSKITPKYSIITSGKDNSYGHPHKESLNRFKDSKSELHRTDQCGTIIFTSSSNGISTNCSKANFEPGTTSTLNNNKEKTTNNSFNDNISSNNSKEKETTKSVYLSKSGKKYHSVNTCGNMNPNNARKVSLESVLEGYSPCSKCI